MWYHLNCLSKTDLLGINFLLTPAPSRTPFSMPGYPSDRSLLYLCTCLADPLYTFLTINCFYLSDCNGFNYVGLPVRPLIFLKKQKISLEELYGYASSDEESVVDDNEVPPAEEAVDDHDGDVHDSDDDAVDDANNEEQMDQHAPLCDGACTGIFNITIYFILLML